MRANPRKYFNNFSANYLEILLNALRCDGLGDHDHVPLDVEADQDLAVEEKKGFYAVNVIRGHDLKCNNSESHANGI